MGKKTLLAALAIAVFSLFIYEGIIASSSGMTGRTLKPGSSSGCTCHSASPNSSVLVNIIGPSTMGAGDTATFMLKIKGGPLSRGGCDIASSSGSLILSSSEAFLKRVLESGSYELTHTSPKAPSPDTVTFTFKFIAPSTPGSATIYANGNSVNNDGTSSGDSWNYASSKTISVTATGIRETGVTTASYKLSQNFPNPFNPSTKISFGLAKSGNVSLKVYDVTGREVASLLNEYKNAGVYEMDFNANDYGMTSGMYFYKITSGDFSEVRKMILTK